MRRWFIAFVLIASAAIACAYLLGRVQGRNSAAEGSAAKDASVSAVSEGHDVGGARKKPRVPAGRKTMPLLPGDRPLKEVFAELQARADVGDVVAATRLYRDVGLCSRLRGIDWSNSRLADELLSEKVDAMDAAQLEGYQVQLDAIEARKQVMQRFHSLCDGATDSMLDSLVPNLQKAAQLGEEYARACYLQRGPSYDTRGLMGHPEWLANYRTSVASMVDAGIQAGDWKVVDVLRGAYQPGSESPLAGVLGSDAYQYYRYMKLYNLGADPDRAAQMNSSLAEAAQQLTPAQVADADSWAQTVFQRNFNGSNSTDSTIPGWDPCSFPYE
ncbi:hypothetical protein [Dokdonella ginsengisoli]|uniref:Lipoprotein n=1 Tax=Dokdonella ginsengisoli TaxID=363846 RepID=A0ABV9R107_9GAMM